MAYWFAAAALVLLLELFIGTVYLLVVSAALGGAGLAVFMTGSHTAGIITAAVLSALGIWLVQGRLKNKRSIPESNDLDIGQTVEIIRPLHDNLYEVAYRGTHWQARAENSEHRPASTAVITGKSGNLLLIQLH